MPRDDDRSLLDHRPLRDDRSALDDQAICFSRIAQARGIDTDTVFGSAYRSAAGGRLWLTFRLAGTRFFYAYGALLVETGENGRALGRFINHPVTRLIRDKSALNHHLAGIGVPVPQGRVFRRDEAAAALAFADTLPSAACLKPNHGSRGILVFPDRQTRAAREAAFAAIARRVYDIRVEQSVPGDVVRYFYVRPRAVAVKVSRLPAVTGDGTTPIAGLIACKNAERRRRALPGHPEIRVDAALTGTLADQGCDLDSVPAAGQAVLLRFVSNGFSGGESIACPDRVHPSYARVAETACAALPDLVTATVDMKVVDCTQPAAAGNHWVLELNSNIGVLPYHHPWEGPAQDVTGAVLDFLARYTPRDPSGDPPEDPVRR